MRALAVPLAVGAMVSAAHGEVMEMDRNALYVTDPRACELLETSPVNEAFSAVDFTAFSFAEGFFAPGFDCAVMQVLDHPDAVGAYLSVLCDTPVLIYPDQLAVYPVGETTIQIYSSYEATMVHSGVYGWSSIHPAGVTEYHRCENLSELPLD